MPQHEVELAAMPGNGNFHQQGFAKAELLRRKHKYAEDQEHSRREFEHELFNAESDREVKRKQFEEALADRQMAHATTLAKEQVGAAQSAARAARLAAWATAAAALGAIAQANNRGPEIT